MSNSHIRHLRSTAPGTSPGTVNEGELALNLADGKLFYGPSGGGAGVEIKYVPLAGGTMTGKLTLDGDPTSNLHAATKQYVDGSTGVPSGTRMLFHQTAAPVGWTKDTTANLDDTSLRVTTGTVGSRTANSAFSTVFGKTATDGHQLTVAQMPSHSHSATVTESPSENVLIDATEVGSGMGAQVDSQYQSAPLDVQVSIGNKGGDGSHSHNIDLRVNYHDVIIASKD